MKRTIACLLAALMLLTAFGALAADYTLDQKLGMQLRDGSGLKASLRFTMPPGTRMSALDTATNAVLAALLPAAGLDVRYIRSAGSLKGQEDTTVTLLKGGAQVADFTFTTDGTLEAVRSSLLGTQTYASLKGDGLFLSLLTGQNAQWPGLERALWAMNGADNAWRAQAETKMKPYLDNLATWLQTFTTSGSKQDDAGRTVTASATTVPAAEVKAQLKRMLATLYQDAELLTLLRQQFSPWEAAAYLEPSMLPGFQAAIDALPLTESLVMERHFNAQGAVVLDVLKLPMGGAKGLKSLHYRFQEAADGNRTLMVDCVQVPTLSANQDGAQRTLTMQGTTLPEQQEGMETGSYQGTLVLTPEAGTFTVTGTEAPPAPSIGFALTFKADAEVPDEQNQQSTRDVSLNLKLTPQGFEGVGEQTLVVTGQFKGGVRQSAATHFTGKAIWQDASTQGSITMDVEAATAAPWAIPTVAGVNTIRLDSMTAAQLAQQKTTLLNALTTGFQQLTAAFLPTVTP